MDKLTKKDRINMVYDALKKSGNIHNQADLASAIGASEATISKALKGEERSLTDNLFKRISMRFKQLSLRWLLTGEGAMCCENDLFEKENDQQPDQDHQIALLQQQLKRKDDLLMQKDDLIAMKDNLIAEKERLIQVLLAKSANIS